MNVILVAACVFQLTLAEMGLNHRPEVEMPRLRLEHETSLTEFQDAVEPSWGFRPDVFLNVYTPSTNQIFLMTAPGSYRPGRSVYSSLAHEYVHFIQVKYRGIPIDAFGDAEEFEAIVIQNQLQERWQDQIVDGQLQCGSQSSRTP